MWYSFVPVPFVELAILSPLRCLCAFVQKQWNFLIVPCAFLLCLLFNTVETKGEQIKTKLFGK